ncbi:hypothetical protein THER5_1939 [Bifidobacterium thermacidophilum subsp. thermacidophilum]|uniref:Uncharacterized protein n=1 Tax=Bifidobacterium thermacidophilum subsp. thermacidophilum TaxID=79262 RepID=A0A087E129_9BIFI|nr:hypothetical protein THER5_1939 [Bifidobacterium thermacidophilum subsp. thermacidophilum]
MPSTRPPHVKLPPSHIPSAKWHNYQPETERDGAQATTDDQPLNLALGMKPIIFFTSLELIEISPMLERVFESRVYPRRFCIIPRDNTVAFV